MSVTATKSINLVGISEILHLLANQRSVVTYDGSKFGTVLSRLAFLEQQVLIEIVQKGQSPGYLLIQNGWVVFALQGVLTGQAAAERLSNSAAYSTLKLFALGAASAALAFAAVEAAPAEAQDVEYSSLTTRLIRLGEREFSGVVAVRVEDCVNVWQLDTGKIVAQQQLLNPGPFGPFVQLGWNGQDLPQLTLSAHVPHPEAGLDLLVTPTLPALPVSPEPTRLTVPVVPADSLTRDRLNMEVLVWRHFQSVLDAHLGEAGLRLYAVIHARHAGTVGAPLAEALGLHIERVAGRPAGQEFRRHVAPLTTPSEDLL